MSRFSNDSEKLEFALTALKTIAGLRTDIGDTPTIDDVDIALETLSAAATIADSTYKAITHDQNPAIDLNDLLQELHEH